MQTTLKNRLKLECKSNKCHPDKKVVALVATGELMGPLVILASKKEIDLEHVFRYPLTPVQLSLCLYDGENRKCTLFSPLEKKVPQSSPGTVDACH